MKKLILAISMLLIASTVFSQQAVNRYEVELLTNPNPGRKDTREVNSVLVFGEESLIISSRRKDKVFKEFKYSDVKSVEHSYSKDPVFYRSKTLQLLSILGGVDTMIFRKERHWLTIVADKDFAVLKIENDNYRLLKNEFVIRELKVVNIDEN